MNDVVSELGRGWLHAAELRARLGVSPATLMRSIRAAGPDVVRVGRGRATRYAVRHPWPGLATSRFPVFRITADGEAVSAGELVTLAARQSVWMPAGHIANGLPIEMADARPSGFLGRHFAATHADLRLPARLTDWSDHHIMAALSRRGEDLPGNLVVGEESFARWQALEPGAARRSDYPALANATISGHPPGSSAGGERPKFGVCAGGRHVLVKFAARRGATDPAGQRWCDLLVLESVALDVLASRGVPVARTHLVEATTHWFLESERFDRVGAHGRRSVLSLAAVHDDPADTWARAAARLHEAHRLSGDDARWLRWLDAFGALIANTDRHHHNVVFFTDPGEGVVRLAPAFDQVSMLYAPGADGQVPRRAFAVPRATSDTLDVWADAQGAAHEFWRRGSNDTRVSDDMRATCEQNARVVGA